MVNDAERYKDEDEKQKNRISAKNSLESYAFHMKSTIEDDKIKGKISDEDKKTIIDKCNEVISWQDANQLAEKEEFHDRQKELEKVCDPIITKMCQAAGVTWGMPNLDPSGAGGAPGAGGAAPDGGSTGPVVE